MLIKMLNNFYDKIIFGYYYPANYTPRIQTMISYLLQMGSASNGIPVHFQNEIWGWKKGAKKENTQYTPFCHHSTQVALVLFT